MEKIQNIKIWNFPKLDHQHITNGCNECNLRHIGICEIIKESELKFLSSLSTNIIFKKKSELIQKGDQSNFVY